MSGKAMLPLLMVAAFGAVVGCAPRPDQIAAAPVPPQLFAGLSCPQLVNTQSALNRKMARLDSEQTQSAVDDSVGVLFTLRPLASLSAGNLQDQVALTKGELGVVNARLARDCRG